MLILSVGFVVAVVLVRAGLAALEQRGIKVASVPYRIVGTDGAELAEAPPRA